MRSVPQSARRSAGSRLLRRTGRPTQVPSVALRTVAVPGLGLDGRSLQGIGARVPLSLVLLPGMGLRQPVPSLDELAGRLRAELGEGPVVLLGHSQSCQVVVAAAERDPRIAAVVLVGPTTDPR